MNEEMAAQYGFALFVRAAGLVCVFRAHRI